MSGLAGQWRYTGKDVVDWPDARLVIGAGDMDRVGILRSSIDWASG